jgi:hypothetical protein
VVTTVAMYRSDQLGRRCTIEPNCSSMSTRLAVTSITHERALKTCEASCVPKVVKPFFVPVVHSLLRAVRYVAAPELSSQGDRARSHVEPGGGSRGLGTRGYLSYLLS